MSVPVAPLLDPGTQFANQPPDELMLWCPYCLTSVVFDTAVPDSYGAEWFDVLYSGAPDLHADDCPLLRRRD